MNTNWPTIKIDNLLQVRTEKLAQNEVNSGSSQIVDKISFSSGIIEFREFSKTRTDMILIMPGDLVLSGINAAKGAIGIYGQENDKPATATIHYSSYLVDQKKADIEYLWRYFRSEPFRDLLVNSLPNGIKTELRASKFLSLEIPLPPLPEQKRIINYIIEIEKKLILLNKEHSRLLNLMIALKKSFFEMEYKNIDKIATFYNFKRGDFPTQKTKEGDYPFVTVSGEERTADDYDIDGPAVCVPLISATGHGHASLKRLFYREDKFALANIIGALLPKTDSKILPKYLYHYLFSKKDDVLIPIMKGTANVSLPKERLLSISLSYPDLNKQSKILKIVEKSDRVNGEINTIEYGMALVLPSISAKAFRGEL